MYRTGNGDGSAQQPWLRSASRRLVTAATLLPSIVPSHVLPTLSPPYSSPPRLTSIWCRASVKATGISATTSVGHQKGERGRTCRPPKLVTPASSDRPHPTLLRHRVPGPTIDSTSPQHRTTRLSTPPPSTRDGFGKRREGEEGGGGTGEESLATRSGKPRVQGLSLGSTARDCRGDHGQRRAVVIVLQLQPVLSRCLLLLSSLIRHELVLLNAPWEETLGQEARQQVPTTGEQVQGSDQASPSQVPHPRSRVADGAVHAATRAPPRRTHRLHCSACPR